MMRSSKKIFVAVASGLIASTAVRGVTPGSQPNQYQRIVDRNLFGLKDPPPTTVVPPPVVSSKVTLAGVATILGYAQAFLKVQMPPKPGEPAKEQALTLKEGQRDGDIEVLEINERTGSVRIKNLDAVTTLTFEKDGVKNPASAPPPMGGPAGQPSPGGVAPGAPTPMATPPNPVNGARDPSTAIRALPNRNFHPPGAAAGSGTAGAQATILPAPTPSPTQAAQNPQAQPMTAEEQAILAELERLKASNSPTPPPLPSPLTPTGRVGNQPTTPPAPQ